MINRAMVETDLTAAMINLITPASDDQRDDALAFMIDTLVLIIPRDDASLIADALSDALIMTDGPDA